MKVLYLFSIILIITNGNLCNAQDYALSFDGIDDYVSITPYTNMSPADAVTIEAWIKGDSVSSTKFIYDRVEINDGYGLTVTAAGKARITINGGQASVSSSISVLNGNWNHIAGTYDRNSGNLYIYVNGVQDGSSSYSSVITYNPEPRNGIGGPGASSNYFKGEIGEVRVWSYARSASEILDNMCETLDTPLDSGLIAYWRLNEGANTTAIDSTANNNHGTVMNGAAWVDDNSCPYLSVDEHLSVNHFSVYPNPTSNQTTIQLNLAENHTYRIRLVNVAGHIVKDFSTNGSTEIISREGLSNGLYFIQLMADDEVVGVEKLILE